MPNDITLIAGIDQNSLLASVNSAVNRIPPLKFKVDTQPLGQISRQASEFSKSLQAASARVLAFSATAGQVYLVIRGFEKLKQVTIEVEKALTDINVLFGLSSRQLSTFANDLFRVANQTGQAWKTAADAALEFSRQGLSVSETLRRTKDALTLTRFTGLEVVDSVRAITTAMNSFGDAALNSTQIVEKLSAVDAQFAVSGRDLAEGLSRIGSIAKDTGVSFERLLGLLTSAKVLTGRTGEVVATGLGTIFQRLGRPEALEQLRELGIVTEDINGKFLSSDQILKNLAGTYNVLSDAQRNQIAQMVGGVRQGNILRALMQDLAKETSIAARATTIAATANDFAAKRQEELNKTLAAQFNETVNNLVNASSRIGKLTLEPLFKKLLEGGNALANQGAPFSDNLGSVIGQGMLKGLGNYLAGPGLALGSILITKFFLNFASYAAKSISQIIEGNSRRFAQEQAIQGLLQKEPALYAELVKISSNQALIQEKITQELTKQLTLANAQASVRSAIYAGITNKSFGIGEEKAFIYNNLKDEVGINPRRNRAVGFIPATREILGAQEGGYQAGAIKELNIPKLGPVVYNSAEQVKQFPGLTQPAILPPQFSRAGQNYGKQFQAVHGFNPYASTGYIPNYNQIPNLMDVKSIKDDLGGEAMYALNADKIPSIFKINSGEQKRRGFFKYVVSQLKKEGYARLDPVLGKPFSRKTLPEYNDIANFLIGALNLQTQNNFKNYSRLLPGEFNKYLKFIKTPEVQRMIENDELITFNGKPIPFFHFTKEKDLKNGFNTDINARPNQKVYLSPDVRGLSHLNMFMMGRGLLSGLIRSNKIAIGPENNPTGSSYFNAYVSKILDEEKLTSVFGNYHGYPVSEIVTRPENVIPFSFLRLNKASYGLNRRLSSLYPNGLRASNGIIPNFSALSDAISREHSAGIPLSQIRVGNSSQLISNLNPAGLGVYNTKDEPHGLSQGISRVAAAGLNPKTAGIPNFAKEDLFKGIIGVGEGVSNPLDLRQLNDELNKFRTQISLGQRDQTDLNRSIRELKKKYDLSNDAVDKITKSYTALYQPILAQQKRLQDRRQGPPHQGDLFNQAQAYTPPAPSLYGTGYGGQYPLSPTLLNRNLSSELRQQLLAEKLAANKIKNYQNIGLAVGPELQDNLRKDYLRNLQQSGRSISPFQPFSSPVQGPPKSEFLFNQYIEKLKLKEQKRQIQPFQALQDITKSNYQGLSLTGLRQSFKPVFSGAEGLRPELRDKLAADVRTFYRQASAEIKTLGFEKDLAGLGAKDIFTSFLPNSRFQQLRRASERGGFQQSFRNADQALRGRAFTSSFVLPVLGGILENGIGTFAGDSKGGRGAARLAGGLANVASFAQTGFGILGPYGAIGGAALGLATELPSIIQAFSDTLPDLQSKLEKLKETSQATSVSINAYIDSSEQLSSIFSGETTGIKVGQIQRLENQRNQALLNIPNPSDREQLRALIQAKDIYGAREFQANLEQIDSQRISGNLLEQSIPKFLKNFKSVEDIKAEARKNAPLSQYGTYDPGALARQNAIIAKEINRPERQNQINQYVAGTTSFALGLTNKEGKNLLDTLLLPKNLTKLQEAQKNGNDLIDVLNSVGKEAGIDSISLLSAVEALKQLSKGSEDLQKKVQESLSPEELKKADQQSREFFATVQLNSKSLVELSKRLIDAQDNFERFGLSLEKLGQTRLSNLTGSLQSKEILQKSANQTSLLNEGGQLLGNLYNLKDTTLKNKNEANIGLTQLSNQAKASIFDTISNTRAKIVDDLRKSLDKEKGTLSPDEFKRYSDRIESISKFFDTNPELLKIKRLLDKPENLTPQDLNKIDEYFKGRINLFEQFRQISDQLPIKLQEYAEKAGQPNIGAYLKTPEGSGFIKSQGLTPQIVDILSSPTQTPKEIGEIIRQSKTELSGYEIGREQFKGEKNKFELQANQILNTYLSNNKVARTQFEVNRNFIGSQNAIDIINRQRVGAVNLTGLRNQFNLNQQQIGNNPFTNIRLRNQNEFEGRTNQLFKAASQSPALSGFNFGNLRPQDIDNLVEKQKELVAAKAATAQVGDKELESQKDTLNELLRLQTDINNLEKEKEQNIKDQTTELKQQLSLSGNRQTYLRAQNEGLAITGRGSQIDFGNNILSGFKRTSADFYNDLSKQTEQFGLEFTDAFTQTFAEASRSSKKFSDILRDNLLRVAQDYVSQTIGIGIKQVFGLAASPFASLFGGGQNPLGFSSTSGIGTSVKKYTTGGFVNMGSGTKDDVPALLTGGEFVINRRAVNAIGKENLDILNGINVTNDYRHAKNNPNSFAAATLRSSIETGDQSGKVNLANAFLLDNNKKGKLIADPSLSTIGLTDPNNPQNKLRLAREKQIYNTIFQNRKIANARSAFEQNQLLTLAILAGTTGFQLGTSFAGRSGQGIAPTAGTNASTSQTYELNGNFYQIPDQLPSGGSQFNVSYNYGQTAAKGGLIRRMATGGLFGGDTPTDKYPAMLMGGEYVVKPSVVNKYGTQYFEKLNNYASGGYVGGSSYTGGQNNDISNYLLKLISVSQQINDTLSKGSPTNVASNNPTATNSQTSSSSKGGDIVNNISINITMASNGQSTSSVNTSSNSNAQNEKDRNDAQKLSDIIQSQVVQVITQQSRNGGLLYEKFQPRRR